MAQPVPTKAFLQPAKTAAICTACPCPPPPVPPFLLVQNLSSKPITPTDNMQPKLSGCVHSSSVVKGLIRRLITMTTLKDMSFLKCLSVYPHLSQMLHFALFRRKHHFLSAGAKLFFLRSMKNVTAAHPHELERKSLHDENLK